MTIDTTSVNTIIGSRIREQRQAIGMTQAELREQTGITSAGFLSDLENGKTGVSAENLFAIANALEVDVNFFFKPLKGST